MTTPFGTPFEVRPRSLDSTVIVEPTTGFNVGISPLNLKDGATPNSDNYIMREGRLEVRSALSTIGHGLSGDIGGGMDVVDVSGARYLLVAERSGGMSFYFKSSGATVWTGASYASAFGFSDPPLVAADLYWDFTQIFSDQAAENLAVGGLTSRNSGLYCWKSGATVFSTLTGSPGARYVAAYNDYLLAANTQEGGDAFGQRVRWCDRGSASSWTGGTSGYQDLLSAKGEITRILPLERRIIVFFADEIWEGTSVDFPFTFNFAPLDTSVGCPYPRTATVTPLGIMFMARNFQLYLLPKEGGTAQPVGLPIHRKLRDTIVQAPRAFGVYDGVNNFYHFYYSSGGSANMPHRALFLSLNPPMAWAPQSFKSELGLTFGFTASLPTSRVSTWDEMSMSWDSLTVSWNDLLGIGNERQAVVLTGNDCGAYMYDSNATRDSTYNSGTLVSYGTFESYWDTRPLFTEAPAAQKALTEIRVEYVADSLATLSVLASPSQGAAFSSVTSLPLVAASGATQAIAYPYLPARYPMVRVGSSGATGYALHRLELVARVGGR